MRERERERGSEEWRRNRKEKWLITNYKTKQHKCREKCQLLSPRVVTHFSGTFHWRHLRPTLLAIIKIRKSCLQHCIVPSSLFCFSFVVSIFAIFQKCLPDVGHQCACAPGSSHSFYFTLFYFFVIFFIISNWSNRLDEHWYILGSTNAYRIPVSSVPSTGSCSGCLV